MILFRDVLVLEKNMVAFGATREIQRKFRKWIWWLELAGNDKKPPHVNSIVCVCLRCFRREWRQPAAGRRRREAGRRLERTGHVREAMMVVDDGGKQRPWRTK